ncbi:hypothetical protein [Blastomonas sp. AAP53]|uniref:hypothetical protein n=1 Tax=Blastomonas sp. AAP53 TaxID=1248760 RepID=UPI0003032D4D|nr:hypothetical protein [Blastomonas sp. AAP53]
MIELVPYMLMLAWASPGEPGRIQIERVAQVFASQADCEKAAAVHVAAARREGVTHRCMAIPARDEFDRLFAELDAREARK